MKHACLLGLALMLGACATTAPVSRTDHLFLDRQFPERVEVPTAQEIFRLTPEMQAYLQGAIERRRRNQSSPAYALYDVVHQELKLDYDTAITRTAEEAFKARAGNCLSLVVLTAAMARELALPVTFQSVYGFETWSRAEGFAFLSGHVNLLLNKYPRMQGAGAVSFEREMLIDFVEDARRTANRVRPVGEATVVAMFLNNRAAEWMAAGRLDAAYWHARAALQSDPQYLSAYNTLAVIYLRHGNLRAAERVLDVALQREPGNARMLTNLVKVLDRDGRAAEASLVRQRLAALEPYPPFYFLDRGKAQFAAGDVRGAMALFQQELKRIPYDHELHFAMALAGLRLGESDEAREHLQLAMLNSGSRDQRAIYASKLEHLKALEVH